MPNCNPLHILVEKYPSNTLGEEDAAPITLVSNWTALKKSFCGGQTLVYRNYEAQSGLQEAQRLR